MLLLHSFLFALLTGVIQAQDEENTDPTPRPTYYKDQKQPLYPCDDLKKGECLLRAFTRGKKIPRRYEIDESFRKRKSKLEANCVWEDAVGPTGECFSNLKRSTLVQDIDCTKMTSQKCRRNPVYCSWRKHQNSCVSRCPTAKGEEECMRKRRGCTWTRTNQEDEDADPEYGCIVDPVGVTLEEKCKHLSPEMCKKKSIGCQWGGRQKGCKGPPNSPWNKCAKFETYKACRKSKTGCIWDRKNKECSTIAYIYP